MFKKSICFFLALILSFSFFAVPSIASTNSKDFVNVSGLTTKVVYAKGLYITASGGTVNISSNGSTWSTYKLPSEDPIIDLTWNGKLLVGVGEKGTIVTSTDGYKWAVRDSGTEKRLRTVIWDGKRFIAGGDEGIICTSDDGATWFPSEKALERGFGGGNDIFSLAWNDKQYVAVGRGIIATSTDGTSWTKQYSASEIIFSQVIWADDKFIAVGGKIYGSNRVRILTSSDGSKWEQVSTDLPIQLSSIIKDGSRYFGAGANGLLATSEDLSKWTVSTTSATSNFLYITKQNNLYVATGSDGLISTSSDGSNWNIVLCGKAMNLHSIKSNGKIYVAVGEGVIMYSADARNWTEVSSLKGDIIGRKSPYYDVEWNGKTFVAVGEDGAVAVSSDGMKWNERKVKDSPDLRGIIWAGKLFVAHSSFEIYTSADGLSWTFTLKPEMNITDMIWNGKQFIGIGTAFKQKVILSTDGTKWTEKPIPSNIFLRTIAWNGKGYVAIGGTDSYNWKDKNLVFTSKDGVKWIQSKEIPTKNTEKDTINDIIYDGKQYIAAGSNIYISKDNVKWTKVDSIIGKKNFGSVNVQDYVLGSGPYNCKKIVLIGKEYFFIGDKGLLLITKSVG